MNDLTPPKNQTLTSTRCAVSLGWLAYELADPRYPGTATRSRILQIAPEPEVRQSLKALSEKFKPATPDQLAVRLARLSLQFWQPDQTEEAIDDRKWTDYCAALSGITDEQMADACMMWLRGPNAFFPKPGQLLAFVEESMAGTNRRRRGLDEITQALDRHDPEPEPEPLVSLERMRADLERAGFRRNGASDLAALKEEILSRPKIPNRETPRELKLERQAALQRRLMASKTG